MRGKKIKSTIRHFIYIQFLLEITQLAHSAQLLLKIVQFVEIGLDCLKSILKSMIFLLKQIFFALFFRILEE